MGKPHALGILPASGNSAQEGHPFCCSGGKTWGSEVFPFLSTRMLELGSPSPPADERLKWPVGEALRERPVGSDRRPLSRGVRRSCERAALAWASGHLVRYLCEGTRSDPPAKPGRVTVSGNLGDDMPKGAFASVKRQAGLKGGK